MKSRTNIIAWVIAIVVIVAIIVGVWYVRHEAAAVPEQQPAAAATAADQSPTSRIEHPIAAAASAPAPASTVALPTLADSDASVLQALTQLGGSAKLGKRWVSQHVIERVVATVDALPRRGLGRNVLPLKPPTGTFNTDMVDGQPVLDTANFARYAPYVDWAKQADVAQTVSWYVRTYPLFQQAYEQLGYPHGYFNDRLVAVIQHLLKAPEPNGSIKLVKTDKGYAFADPSLENLSAGQKMMVRVGSANEKLIKQKLRAFLTAVTGAHNPAKAASQNGAPRDQSFLR